MIARKNIPNLLTVLRLFLAGGLFALLAFYRFDTGVAWLLIPAIVMFIAAAVTDALDGYLARKWEVVSKFGRIMDPFCDKVLVLGAVVFLAGPGFVDAHGSGALVSGVYPWMVVLVISRELLVTGIRGEMESTGHNFGANVWGKLKMVLQSVVVPVVLLIVLLFEADPRRFGWLAWVRDVLVYATVLVTLLSGLPYITGAMKIARADGGSAED
ncbi:MAG: CDP-diacylglycerol--glycerol-3-phosphate 3-phosphatidyltransferase [Phycisphaerales bacterium JB063]